MQQASNTPVILQYRQRKFHRDILYCYGRIELSTKRYKFDWSIRVDGKFIAFNVPWLYI